ncbi:MAG TPA: aminotransferase class III-fold pyridoxal phosphate-dependent enzyme [Solirubrobacteraceae bacterium]|jgi:ornithine--oxo-acid transaminase|nr:aminotransferase class III-fold pyridoxal phosphate-dependent enzyme [Solirubrobacteraceae bacterium]
MSAIPDTAPAIDSLGVLAEVSARADETLRLAARHLDPSLVDVLRIIGFDKEYATASGSYLYDRAGRAYLDFHTGEGFASLGHNHPDVREVLHATLAADLADGVQIHYSPLAGMLAEALSRRLPGALDAVYFTSTGAEAVDSAIKFARAATRRPRLISCESGFHGVTLGPLSIVGDEFFKEGFGPLLPGCERVPFGDLARLEAELRAGDVAAFIVEPIQGREVTLPPDGYLHAAQELCRHHGTLFVADEIQTGLGRTGRWFALEHSRLEPDFVLIGKALSGGYMPVAAMVTTREIYQQAVGTLERSYVHQSTFGRNRLSMAAGLATMRIIERDRLVEHAAKIGALLRDGLAELQARREMIKQVRASGLMIGIELRAPSSRVAKLNWRLIHMASEGLFPQLVVIPLHRDHGVITMAAGKNDVIKLLPPLTLSEREAQSFLTALDAVLADCEGSGGKNWALVRDIATATLRRRAARDVPADDAPASDWTPLRGAPIDPARDDVCLVTGASGFIGGRLAKRLVQEGHAVRCLVRSSSDTSHLDGLDVEIAVGDLTSERSLARAVDGCDYVFHCGALVSDWATTDEITKTNVDGTRSLLEASVGASVQRFIHFSTTDVYGYPGGSAIDENHAGSRFRNWYAQTKLDAEAEVRRAEAAHALDAVILRPSTVYGPGSIDVVGEIARAIRSRNMLLVGGGRSVAGLCYVDNLMDAALLALRHDAAPGQAFNVSDGLDVTWREFTDGLAEGLGCSRVRWSMPYWMANGVGFSLEHGYRLLRRTTGLRVPPLLSRQAVHVLGTDQDFCNRKARETLGWEPRVDYPAGLQATVDWLRAEYLGASPA